MRSRLLVLVWPILLWPRMWCVDAWIRIRVQGLFDVSGEGSVPLVPVQQLNRELLCQLREVRCVWCTFALAPAAAAAVLTLALTQFWMRIWSECVKLRSSPLLFLDEENVEQRLYKKWTQCLLLCGSRTLVGKLWKQTDYA